MSGSSDKGFFYIFTGWFHVYIFSLEYIKAPMDNDLYYSLCMLHINSFAYVRFYDDPYLVVLK